MSLRDHLAAVRDRINEAIDSIDAVAAEPGVESVPEVAQPEASADVAPEYVPDPEPVRDGGPASV